MGRRRKESLLRRLLPGKRSRARRPGVQIRRPKAPGQSGVRPQSLMEKLLVRLRSLTGRNRGGVAVAGSGYRPGRTPMAVRPARRLRLAGVLVAGGLLLAATGWGVVTLYNESLSLLSRVFIIEHIQVDGVSRVPRSRVLEQLGAVCNNTGMYDVDVDSLEQQLEELPWVQRVHISRNLLTSTLRVRVTEEKAVAILPKAGVSGKELYYMDRYGHAFQRVEPGDSVDYPTVTGFDAISDERVAAEAWGEVLSFLNKLWGNNAHLPAHSLSEIHVSGDGGIVLYLVEYPFPIYFGRGRVKRKYARLVEVLKPLYESEKGRRIIEEVKYIQMEYLKDKVLVATTEPAQTRRKPRKQARK